MTEMMVLGVLIGSIIGFVGGLLMGDVFHHNKAVKMSSDYKSEADKWYREWCFLNDEYRRLKDGRD